MSNKSDIGILSPASYPSFDSHEDDGGCIPMDISDDGIIDLNYGVGLDSDEFMCTSTNSNVNVEDNDIFGNVDHPKDITQRKFVHARRNKNTIRDPTVYVFNNDTCQFQSSLLDMWTPTNTRG